MTGIELIAKERKEQLEKHSRTVVEDANMNCDDQLSFAASCLAFKNIEEWDPTVCTPTGWDQKIWEKMVEKPHEERLKIAGALIAAELDRISFLKAHGIRK